MLFILFCFIASTALKAIKTVVTIGTSSYSINLAVIIVPICAVYLFYKIKKSLKKIMISYNLYINHKTFTRNQNLIKNIAQQLLNNTEIQPIHNLQHYQTICMTNYNSKKITYDSNNILHHLLIFIVNNTEHSAQSLDQYIKAELYVPLQIYRKYIVIISNTQNTQQTHDIEVPYNASISTDISQLEILYSNHSNPLLKKILLTLYEKNNDYDKITKLIN